MCKALYNHCQSDSWELVYIVLYFRALVLKLVLNPGPAVDQLCEKGGLITEPVLICKKKIVLTWENCSFIHLTNTYANSHVLYLLHVSVILGTGDAMINKTYMRVFFLWASGLVVVDIVVRTMKKVKVNGSMFWSSQGRSWWLSQGGKGERSGTRILPGAHRVLGHAPHSCQWRSA